jgi:hypothetical protein
MVDLRFIEAHPYATDVFEWLSERRRFSNIRHPFRKCEFEHRILHDFISAVASSGLSCTRKALSSSHERGVQSTEQMLAQPKHLISYVQSLVRNHEGTGQLKVEIRKAWLNPEDRKIFNEKLKALLNEFEKSTSKFGEPVSILSIVTDG